MATRSVICCVIAILLVNTNTASSLNPSESLDRVRRAIFSANPAQELNSIINEDLTRSSVHSYVRNLVPEPISSLHRSLTSEDILEGLVRKYTADPRVRRAAANNDLQSILDVFNYELGGRVLAVSNSSVGVDVGALEGLARNYAWGLIQRSYPGNVYAQIVTKSLVDQQIGRVSANLRSDLAKAAIPVEVLNQVVSLIGSNRAKRDVLTDLILEVLRPQIVAIINPIKLQFNVIVDGVVQTILSIYSSTLPESPLLAFITNLTNTLAIRITEVIVVIQVNVNSIFDNFINGTTVVAQSRRRRDVDLEFENYYDVENVALELSRKRVTRSLIPDIFGTISGVVSSLFLPITTNLNGIVKNVVVYILSGQYLTIGEIVTSPLRYVLNIVIDTVLPCDVCVSIV